MSKSISFSWKSEVPSNLTMPGRMGEKRVLRGERERPLDVFVGEWGGSPLSVKVTLSNGTEEWQIGILQRSCTGDGHEIPWN